MSSKSFSLTSVFPSIISVTKTEIKTKENPKRATGAVLVKRASKTIVLPRSRTAYRSWIGALSAVGLVAVLAGLSFYIYTINASVSKGFDLKQHQAEVNELLEVQKRLVVEQSALGSINKVNDVASNSGMVAVTNEEFLTPTQLSKK